MQGERSESLQIPRRIVFLFSFFVASEEGYARRTERVLANPPTSDVALSKLLSSSGLPYFALGRGTINHPALGTHSKLTVPYPRRSPSAMGANPSISKLTWRAS